MFTINGQQFDIYAIDSLDTLKDRIAVHFNTLYKYLKVKPFQPKELQDFSGRFEIENLLPSIIDQDNIDFELAEVVNKDYKHLDLKVDVEEPFIAYNNILDEMTSMVASGFNVSVREVWDRRNSIMASLDDQLKKTRDRVAHHNQLHTQLQSFTPVPYTQFYIEKTKYLIDFGPINMSVEDVYNSMKTTDNVPYIVLNNISKIQSDFTPSSEIVDAQYPVGYIVMKVDSQREKGVRDIQDMYDRYSDAIFIVENGHLLSTMVVKMGKRNVSGDDFRKRAMEAFGSNAPSVEKLSQNDTRGIFYCPHQSLDTTILSDMIMNSDQLYDVLAVNESSLISKVKKNVYAKALYGPESFSLQTFFAKKGEAPPQIMVNEQYIRVRVSRTTTPRRAALLQDFISRVIAVYNTQYTQIANAYTAYMPDLQLIPLVTAKTRKDVIDMTLNEIAPDVFPHRYTRSCPNPPTILTDQEMENNTTSVVMRFPMYGESTKRNYICNHSDRPYPGLMINRLSNRDVLRYLPCCYAKDQRSKKGSTYNNYYNNQPLITNTQTQDTFKTGKILPPGAVGFLPTKIDDFFNTILTPDKRIMRLGTNDTKQSFLEAVLIALTYIGNQKDRSYATILNDHFINCLKEENAAAAKQELYDKSVDEIMEIMKTGDLRATWFVNVLERLYDCNIYIFTDEDEGILRVPDHKMQYYKLEPKKKDVILVYQHWGSEINTPQFPRCELMIVTDRDNPKNRQIRFAYNTDVAMKVSQVFMDMIKKYTISEELKPISIRRIPVLYQDVDMYGKCRMVCTEMDDNKMTIMLPPCPPFLGSIDKTIVRAHLSDIMKFVGRYKLTIIQQRKNKENKLVELVVSLGTINGVILVGDDDAYLDSKVALGSPQFETYYDNKAAPLQDEIRLEKTARILRDVALWELSRYIADRDATRETLEQFAVEKFKIVNDVTYEIDKMEPRFEDKSNKMISDGLVVVPNYRVQQRLVYYLGMVYDTSPHKLRSYKDLDTIPSFFSNVTDFHPATGEYILGSKSAVNNLLTTNKRDAGWKVVDHILKNTEQTYFFKNHLVGDLMFYAQNAHSYMHANYIVNTLRTTGINPGTFFSTEKDVVEVQDEAMDTHELSEASDMFDIDISALLGENTDVPVVESGDDNEKDAPAATATEVIAPLLPDTPLVSFAVYNYVNASNITVMRTGDGQERVLAYKIDDIPKYTVLFSSKTK